MRQKIHVDANIQRSCNAWFNECLQFFTNDENEHYSTSAPKAFLNWVAFDTQMKIVDDNSGAVQVPVITGAEQAQPLVAPEQVIQKNGYIYIYMSNESAQKVFFDNLTIHHKRGHLLEEDQYYPFGLTMAGISTIAPLRPESQYKYNDKELNRHEFSDMGGLGWYDYGFRNYDAQIGRFTEQDPLTDASVTVSPYQYAYNDPIANIDQDGLFPTSLLCPGTSGLAVFMKGAGEVISQVGKISSPSEKVISLSADALSITGTISNVITINNEINNHFTDQGVGIVGDGKGDGGDPQSGQQGNDKSSGGAIYVQRTWETDKSTISTFKTADGKIVGYILEPAGPSTTESGQDKRIPAGTYNLTPHVNKRLHSQWQLYNDYVSKSRYILLHIGNFPSNTEGCLLPGSSMGTNAVYGSGPILNQLNNYIN